MATKRFKVSGNVASRAAAAPIPQKSGPGGMIGAGIAFVIALVALIGVGALLRTTPAKVDAIKADSDLRVAALTADFETMKADQAAELKAIEEQTELEIKRRDELKDTLSAKKVELRTRIHDARQTMGSAAVLKSLEELAEQSGLESVDADYLMKLAAELKAERASLDKQIAATVREVAVVEPVRPAPQPVRHVEPERVEPVKPVATEVAKVEIDTRYLEMKVTPIRKRTPTNGIAYDEREETSRYVMNIRNTARVDYDNLTFVILIYGESTTNRKEYKIIGREEFKFDLKMLTEHRAETQTFVNIYDDKNYGQYGYKSKGTFDYLMDGDGNIVIFNTKLSKFEKNKAKILKFKAGTYFDEDLENVREGWGN